MDRRTFLGGGALALGAAANQGGTKSIQRQDSEQIVRPRPAPGPLDNPLKGWCTYTGSPISQPYRMVFRYVSWRELEPKEREYRFAEWERKTWQEPQAQGKHVVLRVYADYPALPSGIPDWLRAKGVTTRTYTDYGGGQSPDYNHPAFVAGMERLIAAMGTRYNGNPRVAFIELGFLGFWGEWHTYPHSDWFASPATQERILEAAQHAFPNTVLMTRYPGGVAAHKDWIGFFDDLFPQDTDGTGGWEFLPTMRKAGRTGNWRRACIGGEMEPGQAANWIGKGLPRTMAMVEAAHLSWIGPYNPALLPNPSPAYLDRCHALVRRMGYAFRLTEIRCPRQVRQGARLPFAISGVNEGVAPFYYPWQVELALLDAQHKPAVILPIPADIRTWLPGQFRIAAAPVVPHIAAGRYTLALGVRDPWTGKPDIGFANALSRVDGWTFLTEIAIV